MQSPAPKPSEPTLSLLEVRLATLRQERRFNPAAPWWSLFTKAEIEAIFGKPEEAK